MRIKKRYLLMATVCLICVVIVVMLRSGDEPSDLYGEKPGDPVAGLTPQQKEIFERGQAAFAHEFTPRQGLGPRFNGRSCVECHGVAGGADVTSGGVTRVGGLLGRSPLAKDWEKARQLVDESSATSLLGEGGPVVQRRSTTDEFPDDYPDDCKLAVAGVPPQAKFVSLRRPGNLMGAGLIDAVDERAIAANLLRQAKDAPDLVGRTNPLSDPLTLTTRAGRFGWKDDYPNLLLETAAEMGTNVGITSFIHNVMLSGQNPAQFPACMRAYLPSEPNDTGRTLVLLTAFQSLLAPPSKPVLSSEAKRGKEIFERLRCSVCHTPELYTSSDVEIPDPDSDFPKLSYLEVRALENQPVRLYSDLLLHDMGPGLADGIVSGTAHGGEWRTTPLWGIRLKKSYLHDGRARTIEEAVAAHGGQAESVRNAFEKLPEPDRKALLEFVGSL